MQEEKKLRKTNGQKKNLVMENVRRGGRVLRESAPCTKNLKENFLGENFVSEMRSLFVQTQKKARETSRGRKVSWTEELQKKYQNISVRLKGGERYREVGGGYKERKSSERHRMCLVSSEPGLLRSLKDKGKAQRNQGRP